MVYLVSYRSEPTAPFWRAGVLRERVLVDLSRSANQGIFRLYEDEGLSIRSFLSKSQHEREDLLTSALHHLDRGNHLFTLDQVELGPPVPDPEKFLCVGLNYRAHASEVNAALPPVPTIFAKFRNSLVGPTSPIVLPTMSKMIDYEGELTVVIGTRCQGVSEQEALDYVAGYTVCNDVSARDLQMQTSQWTAGKAIDTFAPMGPGIVLAETIPDPQTLLLTTRVNGEVVQHDNTANMIYSVATIIAFLSSFMTLEPGDLIATGTPSGVGGMRQPPLFLRDGDLVEIEIESIGTIRNPVIAPTHAESNEQ